MTAVLVVEFNITHDVSYVLLFRCVAISVVTVSHWPRSVGFGSVFGEKPRFWFCMVRFSDQH